MRYSEYWQVVLGPRSPSQVCGEFDLVVDGLDEWLGTAEAEAMIACRISEAARLHWPRYHSTALAELVSSLEESTKDEE